MAQRTCSVDGCARKHHAAGWCVIHYSRWKRTGRVTLTVLTVEDRFWAQVDITPGCWVWSRGRQRHGYGHIYCDGQRLATHRFSYEMHFGPIPDGLFVLHKCDNPPCVNPSHLSVGTHGDNMRDAAKKGRFRTGPRPLRTHCKYGHEFTEANTSRRQRGRHVIRICRTCHIEEQRHYLERKQASCLHNP